MRAVSASEAIDLDSPLLVPAIWSSWWKQRRTWLILSGLRWRPTTLPTARPISAIPSGRIILPASIASVRRKEGRAALSNIETLVGLERAQNHGLHSSRHA